MKILAITSSPHVKSERTTSSIMLDVLIALIPAFFASVVIFGPRALLMTTTSVASCVLFEYFYFRVTKMNNTITDLSAIVTGVILAFNLPVEAPIYVPIIGAFFAIVIVKQLFGGIGHNFANPATTARVILLVTFAGQMTSWTKPFYYLGSGAAQIADVVTRATPLAELKSTGVSTYSLIDMLVGNRPGSLGETCAIALIIGGIYLVLRRVIVPIVPIVFIGTVALLSLALGQNMTVSMLGGGLIIGAIFMATDYVTSPSTLKGKTIFAVGCGLLTVLIRVYGGFPEGVSFSILLMNIVTPLIDRYVYTRPLGSFSRKEKRLRAKALKGGSV
jgi:electron transport complex protein RnfD